MFVLLFVMGTRLDSLDGGIEIAAAPCDGSVKPVNAFGGRLGGTYLSVPPWFECLDDTSFETGTMNSLF